MMKTPSTPIANLHQRLRLYERLMRLDKPIGVLFLLWPTLWALCLAARDFPDFKLACIFVLGTLLMRSAGCVINDWADRKFDPFVERTKDRPLATGEVSSKEAFWLFFALLTTSFFLIWPLWSARFLGLAAIAVFLAVSYPFTKRFFALPQAYLGIAFGFGIPMAYAAQTDVLPKEAWVLLLANVFWALAYDTEYAMVDRADDLKIGIKTSAISFGRFDVAAVMLCYAACLALIAWVGYRQLMGWAFYVGLLGAALIGLYHFTLIRRRDPARCFRAFLHNTWFGASIFAGIALDYYLW